MTFPIELPFRPPRRPRGGQHGNRNTLKHGFYARTLPSSDIKDLETTPSKAYRMRSPPSVSSTAAPSKGPFFIWRMMPPFKMPPASSSA
jgi:hypothetical protein